jgi:pyrimidine oxygenase
VLTLPPALVARMAVTIDSISRGRFGINIVSGWAKAEYEQMSLWPGEEHFARRYKYSTEYVTVMRELWQNGQSDFKGEYFQMNDCRLLPKPGSDIKIVSAGQSGIGMAFNAPAAFAPMNRQLLDAAAKTGRDVGAYVLFMVIADETDEAAAAKWLRYKEAVDVDALAWMAGQAEADTAARAGSTARTLMLPEGAVNFNMGTIVGSYATCARLLDEAAAVAGTKGLMLTFDDFLIGMDQFGQRIQSLMTCRAARPSRRLTTPRLRRRSRRRR